jgi:exodeoxyribonuclease VII large subunit
MLSVLDDRPIPQTAISVGGLTTYLKALLEEDDQLQQIWVMGEVSSVNPHPKGCFFTLQDPTEKASINCVIWRSQQAKLVTLPQQGEQMVILGAISLYGARGQYRLTVWQCLPGGEGLLSLRYRQLRDRLQAEGLFDPTLKRSIPSHPYTIAVVTSPKAAAWGDIQRTLTHRYPGLQVLFSPAQVQGELAPASIVAAIQRVERDGRAEVLIVARGGGAQEDLACFNDERVVRAIADCPIPVISGIGHERDESLADLAADLAAHTPTAAADAVVPQLTELWQQHQERRHYLYDQMQRVLDQRQDYLHQLQRRLQRQSPDRQLAQKVQSLAWLRQRLVQSTRQQLDQAQSHCQLLREKLTTLDPEAVIRRGYALVRQENGAIVRRGDAVSVGETIAIQLAQGQIQAQVTQVQASDS